MNKIFVIFIAFILLFSNLVTAQESVEAGTTPDSVFYGLDKAMESIRLALTFDLIKIKNVKEFLGSKELDAGRYTQIRLNVDSAKLFLSGQEKSFKIPSKSIKLINSFLIENGKTKTLTLDFDADKSVHQAGSMYIMRTTIKVIEE